MSVFRGFVVSEVRKSPNKHIYPTTTRRSNTKENTMAIKRNLHTIDIVVRTVIGAALVYICFIDTTYIANDVVRWLLGIFGVVNLFAAAFRTCPIYALAGISTYRK